MGNSAPKHLCATVELSLEAGHLDCFKKLVKHMGPEEVDACLTMLIRGNHLRHLSCLLMGNHFPKLGHFELAITENNLDVLLLLWNKQPITKNFEYQALAKLSLAQPNTETYALFVTHGPGQRAASSFGPRRTTGAGDSAKIGLAIDRVLSEAKALTA